MNLSTKNFSKPEFKVLGYNLNFIPTPDKINKKELAQDMKKFGRRIKLRDHFGDTLSEKPIFKTTSTWEPGDNHHTVKTFLEDFSRRVKNGLSSPTPPGTTRTRKNISKPEQAALDSLKSMDDIIIPKADKGGAVVVQDVKSYIKEAERQLRDKTFYKKLNHNPTSEHAALVSNAIDGLRQRELLDKRTAQDPEVVPTTKNTQERQPGTAGR